MPCYRLFAPETACAAVLRVRRALYALRRLGLDVAADMRPASEQHIVLVNRAEVAATRVTAPQA